MKKLFFLQFFMNTKNLCVAISLIPLMGLKAQTLQERIEQCDPIAEYELATMYLEGDGVEKDSIYAADLLLHSAGGGFLIPQRSYSYDEKKAYDKAKEKLENLCKLSGDKNQHYYLALTGFLYQAMSDMLIDNYYSTAENYYKQAISEGSLLALCSLGLMYFYVTANAPSSVNYNGYDLYCPDLTCFESWMRTDKTVINKYLKEKKWSDNDNVAYWLEKAVNEGCGDFTYGAMSYSVYEHLMVSYADGVGIPKNPEKALETIYTALLDTAAYNNHPMWTSSCIMDKIVNKQPELLYTANAKSKLNSIYQLYSDTEYHDPHGLAAGGLGIICYHEHDFNKAFKYLKEAADMGDAKSYKYLAECYKYGRGTQRNEQEEKKWIAEHQSCFEECE